MSEQILQTRNISGMKFVHHKDLGIFPRFTLECRKLIRQKKACNIVVVGQAGNGKSYSGLQICKHLDRSFGRLTSAWNRLDPDFLLPQVVFSYKAYLEVLIKLGMGHTIMFDEPSYAMGKREWYKEVNQALVKTVESARFMVKPLIIPIINMNLLDKTIRAYLIQFMVHVVDRGKALVYKISASQSKDKVYRYFQCTLHYGLLEGNLCDRATCLGCGYLERCMLIRARYERKKRDIQLDRYTQDLEEVQAKEDQNLTIDQLYDIIFPDHAHYTNEGKLNVMQMQTYLREVHHIRIGRNKAYELGSTLKFRNPTLFSDT